MNISQVDACDREQIFSPDEIMEQRASELAADRLIEDQQDTQSEALLLHVTPAVKQTCGLCHKTIDDDGEATVFQRSLRSPSIIAHAACFAADMASTFRILSRGGSATKALRLDR